MKKIPIIKNGFLTFLTVYLLLSPFLSLKMKAKTLTEKEAYNETYYFQSTISGTVTDTNGLPIAGVTIQIGGTNAGTITEFDGSYSIQVNLDGLLNFSAMGFKTEFVSINGRQEINVVMEEDVTQLDEVVLNAGYYTVTEKERTGSIGKVGAEALEKQPVSNPLAALQGRLSGVEITQTSGISGAGFDIKIRGRNSIRTQGNDPLYVIDGVPYASSSLGEEAASGILPGLGFSPLNTINPMDIERIEILKDADATAIYGSRGANGVVLITTKRGNMEGTEFNLNVQSGLGTVSRTMDLLSTAEYLTMRREAFSNDGTEPLPFNAYDVNGTWDLDRQTNWQKVLFGKTSYLNNFQGSLSGGNGLTRFLVSGNFHRQTSVFPGDFNNKKISGLANIGHTSQDKKLTVQFSTNFTWNENDLPSDDITFSALSLAPNAPRLYNEDGTLNWENSTWRNPLYRLQGIYRTNASTLITNGVFDYTLLQHLQLKLNLGYTESHLREIKTIPSTIYNPAFGIGSASSAAIYNTGSRTSWILEPQLNYSIEFGKTSIETLAGLSYQNQNTGRFSQLGFGFVNNNFIESVSAASNTFALTDSDNQYRYQAVFGRVNINHRGKYILNVTGRRDGSSRFGPHRRFSNFGAIGAAWNFSEEDFIKNSNTWLNYGKLRGSYGTSGNDQIGDYQYLDTYSFGGVHYQNVVGIFPTRLFNPDFSWESNKKLELALELGLFMDRVRINGNYYQNRSSNQLVGIPIPSTTGFNSVNANLEATVENKGWEIGLNTLNVRTQNFAWETSINITIPKNRLVSFPNLEGSTYSNSLVVGEPVNIAKVYQLNRVDPISGLYEFEDFNNDGIISPEDDQQVVKSLDPEYFGGFNNRFTLGKFEMDVLFQFSKQLGRNYWSTGGTIPGGLSNQPTEVLQRWSAQGDQRYIQRFTTGQSFDENQAFQQFTQSDTSISDASFLRLKTLSMTYALMQKDTHGYDCQLYLQGQNLLTFTHYLGLDPETRNSATVPPLRIISLGTRLTF